MPNRSQTTPESEALGAVVRRRREQRGMTPQQLAQRLEFVDPAGWDVARVRRLEYGRLRHPPLRTLRALQLVLGLSLDELIWAQPEADALTRRYRRRPSGVQQFPMPRLLAVAA